MSFVDIKSKFHVAFDGQGLLLQGAPDRLAYQQGQAAVYGTRFASGDRSYNDLSQWWYFVQTSWAAGFKDSTSWDDDAKYYYSTNIDAWSENGAIKLARIPVLVNDFSEEVICGGEFSVNGTTSQYIGTGDDAGSEPRVYKLISGVWTHISATPMPTTQNVVSQLSARLGILWMSTVGVGDTYVVGTYTGATATTVWADQGILIGGAGLTGGALTHDPASSRCHVEYAGVMYVFVDNTFNNQYALVSTTTANPTTEAAWTKIFERLNINGRPVACAVYNGKLYYLVNFLSHADLRVYDIAAATDTSVQIFKNTGITNWGVGDKLLTVLNGKLIITIPTKEIWQIDGSTLTRIFVRDTYKANNLLAESYPYLGYGAVITDNKAWWGNLMYDGTYFFNTFKELSDSSASSVYPMFIDADGLIYHSDSVDTSKLYSYTLTGASYKGTADKNFLVFSNFDLISGVDKLAYSVTILFKPLISGQSIIVEYFLGEITSSTSWTVLGTASFAIDAGVVSDKTFFFPVGTTFKKIWFRVKMTAGGSDTPTMNDIIMEYLPVPTFKKNWTINVNCADDVRRLDGALVSDTGRELKGKLERSWWTKSVLDFQDLDYATTLINGALNATATTVTVDDTADFPEQGRLRIDDEEITYTGKTPTTFTGCTRGARSTRAVTHSDNAVINNAYKVILTDFSSRIPITLEDKELEYTVGLSLREV
jgi:hypothetical protein